MAQVLLPHLKFAFPLHDKYQKQKNIALVKVYLIHTTFQELIKFLYCKGWLSFSLFSPQSSWWWLGSNLKPF